MGMLKPRFLKKKSQYRLAQMKQLKQEVSRDSNNGVYVWDD